MEGTVTPISRGMAVHDNTFHNPNMLRSDQRVPLGNMPDGTATHVLTANGAGVNPSYQAAGAGVLPSGCIVMWSGLLANIPAGYILCDGGGGSPNLLTRVVRQVPDAITNPGGTGGANTHTPAQHVGAGGHQHNTEGAHTHNSHTVSESYESGSNRWGYTGPSTHASQGGHNHDAIGNHQHDAHDTPSNVPVYFELAFIMKT